MDSNMSLALLVPLIAIVGGFAMAGLAFHHQTKRREMAHLERMAMIERGLMPPPEMEPVAFVGGTSAGEPLPRVKARSTTAGITLIGIGFGLMVLIAFAANEPQTGVGVGGAIAILGAAFFANNYLLARTPPATGVNERPRSGATTEPERRDGGGAAEVD